MKNLQYLKNKRIFITGHTGFKGSWLCAVLLELGAKVFGYALTPPQISMYNFLKLDVHSTIGDIRNFENLQKTYNNAEPDYVIHLAAQPIVLTGYKEPVYTYDVNVMGTVNILECIRQNPEITAFLNVTTDKVYFNDEKSRPFIEEDILDGNSPYENSKSCSELITNSYRRSFKMPPIFTARAGNVIGGGDFAENRIIPDCFRALSKKETIFLRNPNSVRPFQHVLECLASYLLLMSKPENADCYNIGPDLNECVTTLKLTEIFCKFWGDNAKYEIMQTDNPPKESDFLQLDNRKFCEKYNTQPKCNITTAIEKTALWYKAYQNNENITLKQVEEFLNE